MLNCDATDGLEEQGYVIIKYLNIFKVEEPNIIFFFKKKKILKNRMLFCMILQAFIIFKPKSIMHGLGREFAQKLLTKKILKIVLLIKN